MKSKKSFNRKNKFQIEDTLKTLSDVELVGLYLNMLLKEKDFNNSVVLDLICDELETRMPTDTRKQYSKTRSARFDYIEDFAYTLIDEYLEDKSKEKIKTYQISKKY